MLGINASGSNGAGEVSEGSNRVRGNYRRRMQEIQAAFEAGASGAATIAARAELLDGVVKELWDSEVKRDRRLGKGIALLAVGGYGRREMFPYSDVDLLFLLGGKIGEKDLKEAMRRVGQELWDCGIRVAPTPRRLAECEQFNEDNPEFTISLLDHRLVTGDEALSVKLTDKTFPKLLQRGYKPLLSRLVELTESRHAKFGGTIFHLEPNIKDCPGGLRDVNLCGWISAIQKTKADVERDGAQRGSEKMSGGRAGSIESSDHEEFHQAVEFLYRVRCFLHYRHERDDNTLDWQAQDAAAVAAVGLPRKEARADAAYWMRLYFRHARSIDRQARQRMEEVSESERRERKPIRLFGAKAGRRAEVLQDGFGVERGRIVLGAATGAGSNRAYDPALDPDLVLKVFAAMARTGCSLSREAEQRLSDALPLLSAQIEEGPVLWRQLQAVLTEPYAGDALRAMHALGVLELLIPEFHGIDALVIRDAYHRYTVDEHTLF